MGVSTAALFVCVYVQIVTYILHLGRIACAHYKNHHNAEWYAHAKCWLGKLCPVCVWDVVMTMTSMMNIMMMNMPMMMTIIITIMKGYQFHICLVCKLKKNTVKPYSDLELAHSVMILPIGWVPCLDYLFEDASIIYPWHQVSKAHQIFSILGNLGGKGLL